jgi:hypothetical protein
MKNSIKKLSVTTFSSALIISLGSTFSTSAAELNFNIVSALEPLPISYYPIKNYFIGTFSYDSEVSALGPRTPGDVVKRYPLSAFSLTVYPASFDLRKIDSEPEAFCPNPYDGLCTSDDDHGTLEIDLMHKIVSLSFIDIESGVFAPITSIFDERRASVSFVYEGISDKLPSTTEEFLAALGTFKNAEFSLTRRAGGRTVGVQDKLGKVTITAASSPKPVPEPSSVGAISFLGLGLLLKRKIAFFKV